MMNGGRGAVVRVIHLQDIHTVHLEQGAIRGGSGGSDGGGGGSERYGVHDLMRDGEGDAEADASSGQPRPRRTDGGGGYNSYDCVVLTPYQHQRLAKEHEESGARLRRMVVRLRFERVAELRTWLAKLRAVVHTE